MASTWLLAIDLGTSNTAAACLRGGRIESIRLDSLSESMPSSVFRDGSEIVVGRAAENRMRTSPGDFEPHPKLLLGRAGVMLGGELVDPIDLVASVLRYVRTRAIAFAGSDRPERVWLTHPDEWTSSRRDALREAAVRAGFDADTLRLASEPVCAAAFYAGEGEVAVGSRVAVFDSGGGTSDVAVLESTGAGFRVLASDGDERLGGNDFDESIREWVMNTLRSRGEAELADALDKPEALAARLTLRNAVRSAKVELSEYPRVPIGISVGGRDAQLSLTRSEYEGLIAADVARAGRLLTGVLEKSGTPAEDLAGVYLTGGTSQTPALATEIQRVTGRAPATLSDPKLVVARGALHLPDTAATDSVIPTPAVGPDAVADVSTEAPTEFAAGWYQPTANPRWKAYWNGGRWTDAIEDVDDTPGTVAATWYFDPEIAGQLRYWNGKRWTNDAVELDLTTGTIAPGRYAKPGGTSARPAKRAWDGTAWK
ncbi:MAG: Hsp70 family protein [Pseudolysinimonas sp.]